MDSEDQNGQQSDGFEPRWWWWAGLIGLIIGWLVGLNVKPDVDDLHQAALDLVPPSAEVVAEKVQDKEWFLFTPFPPRVVLELISDSTPERLAEDVSRQAELFGWTVSTPFQGREKDSLSLRSVLLESRVHFQESGWTKHDALVIVEGRDDIGTIVTGLASLTAGVLAAIVVGLLTHYRHGERRTLRHTALRWWHLLGVVFMAFVYWLSVQFVV